MNIVSIPNTFIFQNPDQKPLEDLKLVVESNGVSKIIPALDKYWIEKKYFLNYETPNLINLDGKDIFGAKERWFELTNFILDDLTWLLHLPFYKFWSNIIYNPSIMDSIVMFLQEAPTFCTLENFLNDYNSKEHFNKIRQNILIIFARLVTNKESSTEYLSLLKHAHLLYNQYVFTVPILMDICQQYGRDNKKTVEKIINSVFTLQPFYKEDLNKAVIFITQVLRKIERRFEDCPINQDRKAIPLSERGEANIEISLSSLEDIILYLLDTVSTVSIFLDIYAPSATNFKVEDFISKIITIYSNTIPEMYKRLNDLAFNDEIIPKYMELKHRLDVTRIEILKIYRIIIYKKIKDIITTNYLVSTNEIGEIVEDFLFNLMHTLSEKEFIIDYHNIYPVTDDFQILLDLYPDLDTVKCEFIINSIFTFLDEPIPSLTCISKSNVLEPSAGSSYGQKYCTTETCLIATSVESPLITANFEIELISDIKDIFCNLAEGMIQKCLKHYNYDKAAVINAVLEDTLPIELKTADQTLPHTPSELRNVLDVNDTAKENKNVHVYDPDKFDIMTKDDMPYSKKFKGKKKDNFQSINELLNEKSHIAERRDIYNKYNLVTDEYDDEYDDTYDNQDIGSNVQDNIIEIDTRNLSISTILGKQENNCLNEGDNENDFKCELNIQKNNDNFVKNPMILRAKAEERQLNKQRIGVFHLKKKNIGQDKAKEYMDSRNKKNKYKTSKVNHDRRNLSQWKYNQGTFQL